MGLLKVFYAYAQCQNGATVVEYALIAAGMAAAIITTVFLFGDQMGITMTLLDDSLAQANQRFDGIDAD